MLACATAETRKLAASATCGRGAERRRTARRQAWCPGAGMRGRSRTGEPRPADRMESGRGSGPPRPEPSPGGRDPGSPRRGGRDRADAIGGAPDRAAASPLATLQAEGRLEGPPLDTRARAFARFALSQYRAAPAPESDPRAGWLVRVEIENTLDAGLSPERLVPVAGLPVFHFCREFKRCTGRTAFRRIAGVAQPGSGGMRAGDREHRRGLGTVWPTPNSRTFCGIAACRNKRS